MIKLIIFFRQPGNPDQFEDRFANHVQLIGKMPGVKRTVVNRAIGAPRGEPAYFLIHEVFFTDLAAANYALNAPEGRMAGADLMSFAREITTLLFTEVWGEDPEPVAEPAAVVSPELEAELAAEQSLAGVPAIATTPVAVAEPVAEGVSAPAALSTAAAAAATSLAMAMANAAPESLAVTTPAASTTSLAPELDALPADPEVFGVYSTPQTPAADDTSVIADVPEIADKNEFALETGEMSDQVPEVVEAALLDGAVIDGEIVTDQMPVEDVDAEGSDDKPVAFGP